MSETKEFNAELLRPLDRVCEPDPRNTMFVKLELRHLHQALSERTLHAKVPEDIVMQFETARNLYLYSWFVYRFYSVCEHQALACLELALRKRYEQEAPKKYRNRRDGKLYLRGSLRYSIDCGHVKHEGFRRWHEAARRRATLRYEMNKIEEMRSKGLKEIALDCSEVEVTDADRNWEYLDFLSNYLPEVRNEYAHGTPILHNQVLTTLEVVSEIINQIYPAE